MCGEEQWWWLQKQDTSLTTTVGTNSYSLASITDLREIAAVRLQTSTNPYPGGVYDLMYMPEQELRSNEHMYRDNGTPYYWTEVNGALHLWPYPDLVYTIVIDYTSRPPDLAAGGDVPVMDPIYHDILVWGAIAELSYRERDVFNGRAAEGKYQSKLEKMRKAQGIRQKQSSRFVKRSGLYDTPVSRGGGTVGGTW